MEPPRVDFYLDADSKVGVAASLANKGIRAGIRLLVLTNGEDSTARVDRGLWTASPLSFIPHALAGGPLADESPVVISQKIPPNATSEFGILLNLTDAMPDRVAGFRRVIEIVGQDDQDKATARERFKAYRDMGCEMNTHRLGQSE